MIGDLQAKNEAMEADNQRSFAHASAFVQQREQLFTHEAGQCLDWIDDREKQFHVAAATYMASATQQQSEAIAEVKESLEEQCDAKLWRAQEHIFDATNAEMEIQAQKEKDLRAQLESEANAKHNALLAQATKGWEEEKKLLFTTNRYFSFLLLGHSEPNHPTR